MMKRKLFNADSKAFFVQIGRYGNKIPRLIRGLQLRNEEKLRRGCESLDREDAERELERVEVGEPALERGAENAALTVASAAGFGGLVWLILGKTKAEGR